MMLGKMAWLAWSLVPVAALAYHYGPGQRLYQMDQAAFSLREAAQLEKEATELQAAAYQKHLASIDARRRLFLEDAPENAAASKAAADAESDAFKKSSAAWRRMSERLAQILDATPDLAPSMLDGIRWSRARALVRAGDIWTGIGEFESMLATMDAGGDSGSAETDMAGMEWRTREELASAYYYGARLMRLGGEPEEEWLIETSKARQHFRYLAEQASSLPQGDAAARDYQRNVELVLNLEQSSKEELEGKPLPRESPLGRNGNRPGGRGKSKRPPQNRDARGAGGVGDLGPGW